MTTALQSLIERHVQTLQEQGNKLIDALETGAFEEARVIAHTIRGASGSLGFRRYMEFAQNFEIYCKDAKAIGAQPVKPENMNAFRDYVQNLNPMESEIYAGISQ